MKQTQNLYFARTDIAQMSIIDYEFDMIDELIQTIDNIVGELLEVINILNEFYCGDGRNKIN